MKSNKPVYVLVNLDTLDCTTDTNLIERKIYSKDFYLDVVCMYAMDNIRFTVMTLDNCVTKLFCLSMEKINEKVS